MIGWIYSGSDVPVNERIEVPIQNSKWIAVSRCGDGEMK